MPRPLSLHAYRWLMSGLALILPYYLARRKRAGKEDSQRWQERLGKGYSHFDRHKTTIWLHAVSVGEVMAALSLVDAVIKQIPKAHFIITTGTVTSAEIVAQKQSELPVTHYYAPFDAPRFVDRFFDHSQPDFAILFESDFWPCLISVAHERQIPVYLASAQMSEQSALSWLKRPLLAEAVFGPIAHCFAHDETQKDYFLKLGTKQVSVTGSLKLPRLITAKTHLAKAIKKAAHNRLILLGASTHQGEEAQLLDISALLRANGLDHLLIMAPRHPERGDDVANLMPHAKRRRHNDLPAREDDVFLVDTLGDMPSLYQAADIIWLGATFSGKGGHNPLEAASYGKPIICGLSQFKNQYEFDQLKKLDICHELVEIGATVSFINDLYQDKDRLAEIAKRGKSYASKAKKRAQIVANHIVKDQGV
ncbi:MAG: 3-deoxy-D-manno-octulosonic acid transferase [Candidatus Puniceispirillaceae bacterium]